MNFYGMWSINDNKMHMYNIVFHSPSESNRLPYYPKTIFARCKKESVFHEIRETCHFITFLFPEKKKNHFLILAGSVFYQIRLRPKTMYIW